MRELPEEVAKIVSVVQTDDHYFVAPDVTTDTTLSFRLTVRDSRLGSGDDTVTVTVTPVTTLTVAATDTPLSIPDNNPSGIVSRLTVTQSRVITAMRATVTIDHTWIGDLRVTLSGPGGFSRTLHNRTGRDRNDIDTIFLITEAVGRTTAGTWSLSVSDHARADLGVLRAFSIEFEVGDPPANRPPVAQAGAAQTVAALDTVMLSASGSTDPDADALTYGWQVLSGPAVTIAPSASACAASSSITDCCGRTSARKWRPHSPRVSASRS